LKTSSSTLLLLINDILDLSKIEAGKFDLENRPFLLNKIISDISQQINLMIDTDKVNYHYDIADDIPTVLLGDSLRLGQIILNIFNNAAKFTEQGTISLSVTLNKQTDQQIELLFKIADSGIGMTVEQLERLFKTYTQADSSTTRKYGGTGLGLSISKFLANLMGGNIDVESRHGHGSCFSITLTLEEADSTSIEVQQLIESQNPNHESSATNLTDQYAKFRSFKDKKVLVVDDNKVNLIVATKILEKSGISVTTASNGQRAIEKIDNNHFDIVLMDIQMPIMNGYDATELLRADPKHKDLPIIALSANVMKEDIEKSRQAGMNAHLSKPLNVKALLTLMDSHIN